MASLGSRIVFRVYQDLLMADRMQAYRALLVDAVEHGYQVVSVERWAEMIEQGLDPEARVMIMRHDVDTDEGLTPKWADIEQDVGAGASYFYRLSTLGQKDVETVTKMGFHVSYHFEELAEVAKRRKLRSKDEVLAHMPEIQDEFARNVQMLRKRFGWSMEMVCSHGDWMNRLLGIKNWALLDERVRRELGIRWETYDAELMEPMNAYFSDVDPPKWWKPGDPHAAIAANIPVIGILTHPKQWRSNVRCNIEELVRRVSEGLAYRSGA